MLFFNTQSAKKKLAALTPFWKMAVNVEPAKEMLHDYFAELHTKPGIPTPHLGAFLVKWLGLTVMAIMAPVVVIALPAVAAGEVALIRLPILGLFVAGTLINIVLTDIRFSPQSAAD